MSSRAQRIEEIAVDLTRQRSVTETIEEQLVTEKVHLFFRQMDYFQDNPEDLFFVPVPHDKWGRKSVIALLRGKKDPDNNKTVVLIGHTDTAVSVWPIRTTVLLLSGSFFPLRRAITLFLPHLSCGTGTKKRSSGLS